MKYILSFEIETNEGITYQMFEELAHDITVLLNSRGIEKLESRIEIEEE